MCNLLVVCVMMSGQLPPSEALFWMQVSNDRTNCSNCRAMCNLLVVRVKMIRVVPAMRSKLLAAMKQVSTLLLVAQVAVIVISCACSLDNL